MSSRFAILSDREGVMPYLSEVRTAADAERKSFGFLPAAAYEEFALQKRLLVAICKDDDRFAGYLAFGGTPPQARVFQTYVSSDFRRSGVGGQLLEALVAIAEEASFLSIKASIADDLQQAKEFYRKHGFRPVGERPGGRTTRRTIVTHVRELETPSLFDQLAYSSLAESKFSIRGRVSDRRSAYLIDVNVVFDLAKKRAKAVGAGRVFAAAMENSVELSISSEFITELERNWNGGPDPILEMARALPQYKVPEAAVLSLLRKRIA
ncbi:MAG: GNAT family N-acetyltransferase [Novosphingobium sp.]|nr:GNAT family N-acetyltransferase [Novosphingobium sp.]